MEKKPLTERVVSALAKHGQMNLDDLAKHVDTTKSVLYSTTAQLKKHHGVVQVSRGVYALKGKDAPQPRPAKKKLRRINGSPLVRKARQAPPPKDGGTQFAINERGELGIDAGEQKVKLDADAFTRLREFIERTESVWKGAGA